ncbi:MULTISPECIES: Hsp20/alpha crystallin family protein [Isoptericola]|uniref:Hsp20/alpha crystallin family protein n=1 Tax=Isoptericola sediminis TaxID=2733572 RepID=A0A849JZX1_9MICO|nr:MULTISPECIES: Hsp20/alpha crystallin family protein [Isoptericola]MDO8144077.1 Hsp20/alpha crystallin family protein [Isoptericola sp. 178]MDO8149490.1 Hsp20/alpha crystallin family protein [Isoptericola sp. b515]MDO8152653.1 Hsp20/alpha crystallin family protein [Isoptericola sp. b408]NNU28094.1 Hsp20/alpha crystallin family protein [Isoptericola sediminis]
MATYWDPFQEMDRLFGSFPLTARNVSAMPMDLFREDDHFVLAADLPGIDPGSIDVSVEDRTLTVRAERTGRSGEGQWLLRERPAGTVARQITLGRGLALDHISASYADGVLTLTIPVAEEAKPRRIEVSHRSEPHTIEAGG